MDTKILILSFSLFVSACQITVLNGKDPNQLKSQTYLDHQTAQTQQPAPYYPYYQAYYQQGSNCETGCQNHQATINPNHCIETLCQNSPSYYPYYSYYPQPDFFPYYPNGQYSYYPSSYYPSAYYPDVPEQNNSYYPYYPGSYYPNAYYSGSYYPYYAGGF